MNNIRALVADLVVDIRFSQRKLKSEFTSDEQNYMDDCKRHVAYIYDNRHNVETNRYGWIPNGYLLSE